METHDKPPSQRLPGTSCGPKDYGNWCRQSWTDKRRFGTVWCTNVWGKDHETKDYILEPFNDSATVQKWSDQGFKSLVPGMLYDMRFPEPEWMKHFRHWFPMKHFGWALYCMRPGMIIPEHQDTYVRFRAIHNVTDDQVIRRYVFFLDDWKSGHYLEIDDHPLTKWIQGTGYFWHGDVPHLAANLGRENRYTLQLTGIIDESMPPWRWQHANNSFF